MNAQDVTNLALALTPEERAALIEELLVSFSPALREQIDAAWGEEAERRLREHEAHPERAITWEESMRRISEL